MCGIFASIGLEPDRRCIEIVGHRGPDGAGWEVINTALGPLSLGHRRLAIIDLSDAALQPMWSGDNRFVVVFNGEIYNYLELRTELKSLGHRFGTDSDTEVLIAAYAQWGEAALDRMKGMFSFVLWDERRNRLFAARDRFGIKPLYWVATARGIAFASEIKQLLEVQGVTRRMNLARVRDFLSSGISEHTSETMFADVRQIRGGECVAIDLARWRPGQHVAVRRWYDVLRPGTLEISEKDAAERFKSLLTESVRMHLRSDVPVGSCLSGGLDSSSIVCIMDRLLQSENSSARINTISACYEEKAVDERPFMEEVVGAADCLPHYVYPRVSDAFDFADKITWHQDEPYGSTSIFAQWCVFEEAKRSSVKVMLDGQGADEQLAGYHGSFSYYMNDLIRCGQWATLAATILERKKFHGSGITQQLRTLAIPVVSRAVRAMAPGAVKLAGYNGWLDSAAFESLRDEPSAFDTALRQLGLGRVENIGQLCVAMTQASNVTMLLHWEDRNSMAHGIEARVPFLDHELVEFSIAMGSQHKIVHGDTKRVLRRAMHGIIPEKIENRRDKLGFATPEQKWFRGPLRHLVEAGVEDTLNRYPDLLNAGETRMLTRELLDGVRPIDFTLWRIVNIGIWGRVFNMSIH